MRDRSRGWRGVLVLVVAACALGSHAGTQAQSGPRVLLVQHDSELSARIAGQTRDLALRLEPTSSREPDFDQDDAQALAGRSGAAAVVWITPRPDGGLTVHVLDALRRSHRPRELPPQPAQNEELAASALYEAAALVVRGELSNLLEQENLAARAADAEAARAAGTTGTTGTGGTAVSPNRDRDGDGKPDPNDDDDDDGDDSSDETDPLTAGRPRAARGLWSVRAGLRVARVDADHAAYGPVLGLGVDIGLAALSLQGSTSWPIVIERDDVDVELRRHSLTLHPLVQLTDSRNWRLLAGIDAGVLLYARATQRASGTLRATGDETTLSAVFGATAEVQWWPTRWLNASLTAGLDLLTAPTQFALERRASEQVVHEMPAYEPWATLTLSVTP